MELSSFIIPVACPCCKKKALTEREATCASCQKKLKKTRMKNKKRCQRCFAKVKNLDCLEKEDFCEGRKIYFDKHISLFQLNKDWKNFIKSWKFEGNRFLHKIFLEEIQKQSFFLRTLKIEKITYIKSHKFKKNLRSFQPCSDLARYLAKILKVPYNADLYKASSQQQSKNQLYERFFSIHNALVFSQLKKVPKNYLLVEDVYTSGATANEASRILKKAGVKKVYVLSMLQA